ncbi:hypothetical protein E5221_11645 [Pseudomonas sp. A2]|nr:hypothetical protein E5221_11645 [Pseudomonas sp. A2]
MGGTPVAWIGIPDTPQIPVGAGLPAKKATRWLAPASPVFAGEPAPTGDDELESHAGNQRDVAVGLALASAHNRTGTA